jgi:hypothetical protein
MFLHILINTVNGKCVINLVYLLVFSLVRMKEMDRDGYLKQFLYDFGSYFVGLKSFLIWQRVFSSCAPAIERGLHTY